MTYTVLFETSCSVTGVLCTVTDEEAPFLNGRRLTRTLSLNGECQSEAFVEADGSLSLAQPLELVQVMLLLSLSWIVKRPSPRVLIAGLGGGSLPRALVALSDTHAHCVELEPEVIAAAQQTFALPAGPRCTATAADAGAYLATLAAAAKARCRATS